MFSLAMTNPSWRRVRKARQNHLEKELLTGASRFSSTGAFHIQENTSYRPWDSGFRSLSLSPGMVAGQADGVRRRGTADGVRCIVKLNM